MDLDQIDMLKPDELREVIKRANKALDRQLGSGLKSSKDRLKELLDTKGDNFMGSGMPMHEYMLCMDLDALSRSFHRQDRRERKRRLKYVIQLSAELDRIRREVGIFASGLAEAAIEDVLTGDWRRAKEYAGDLVFETKGGETEKVYGAAYAVFRELLQEAFDTRPEAEVVPKKVH